MDNYYVKKPCKQCPYRKDVKPFLTPARGYQLAYHTHNQYNTFPCHKTVEHDDEEDDYGDTAIINPNETKECAGFMTLQHGETGCRIPEGFEPAWDLVYDSSEDMADAYNPDNKEINY